DVFWPMSSFLLTTRWTIPVAGMYVAARRSLVAALCVATRSPAASIMDVAVIASTVSHRPWTYSFRVFIAVQRASTLVSRSDASPLVLDVVAACAVAAAWIKRRKAAMAIGGDANIATAARIAVCMMVARA